LKVSDRTRLNYRLKVSQLFTFAERRGYIPKHANPVDHTEKPEPVEGEVTIYNADEITALLAAASDDFRPCIALAAFAGLRTSEVLRMTWQDVDLVRGHIKASARKRGTPSRRFVTMPDNLRHWLRKSRVATVRKAPACGFLTRRSHGV
jgi:integrase